MPRTDSIISERSRVNVGDRFGRLVARTAVRIPSPTTRQPEKTLQAFECDCDCGKSYTVSKYALVGGNTKSCGCLLAESAMKPGERVGRWVVIEAAPRSKTGHRRCLCRCDCGTERVVTEGNLKPRGKRGITSLSCGCWRDEQASECGTTHGHTKGGNRSGEYVIWVGIRSRCLNPNGTNYDLYGGRGITMCARWRDSFEAFLADMGPKPSAQHQVDRIDNNGNYEPGNCRWATRSENQNNRECNVRIEHDGKVMTVAEWSEATGLKWSTIRERLKRGWSASETLTTPAGAIRKAAHASR